MKINILLYIVLIFTLFPTYSLAIPSLSGPGGVITIPSAYTKSGGLVAPVTYESGQSDTITSLNYRVSQSIELGLQKPSNGSTGINIKYQLSADQPGPSSPPATAFGFMDQKHNHTKSFYGVMSKNFESEDTTPFILHLGIMSEGSIGGHIRPIAGFEAPVSKQMRIVGEYNGSKRDINSGVVYNFTETMGTFMYLMDIESDGLNSDLVSGFTFNLSF